MEYEDDDGNIIYDEDKILQNWESAFKNLFTNPNGNFDDVFYNQAILHKKILENNSMDPLFIPNDTLNKSISIEEVRKVISNLKNGKSPGIDLIYNEVLRNNPVIEVLHVLFMFCFETEKIPTIWRKALIRPIPKGATIDTRIPLNYRGISLLSVVAKCYSSVLNNRVQQYLEENEILSDAIDA